MMDFLQFEFETQSKEQGETLVALLSEQGFDGFEEEGIYLIAFIPKDKFVQADFEKTLERFSILAYTMSSIKNINWNQKWEEEFQPVVVDSFAAIRAHFHKPIKNVQYEIIITPKMSFGTGHHATTYMVIQLMKGIDFIGKKVLDFGTGTGVLAILAEKMGAQSVYAIDNDEWSINNAIENAEQNNCIGINIQQAGTLPANQQFDIILANINLNVITANLGAIITATLPSAKIICSGFLVTDEATILKAAENHGLKKIQAQKKGEWLALVFEK